MDLFGEPIIEEKEEEAAELPPPAKIEGLVPPREMNFSKGHEETEQKLLALYQSGKLPHAMIFNGPQGIGKATFAFRFARFLLKNSKNPAQNFDVAETDPVFRLILSGGHPDFFVAERAYDALKNRFKDNVDVDEIRKVAPFLRKTASYGGWRVVIIDDADTMNRNAQNALLKILEEPPAKTVLILIVHRIGALIPTIRSRSHVVNFEPLKSEIMKDLLNYGGFDGAGELVELSGGDMGKAIAYSQSGAAEMIGEILKLYGDTPDWPKIHTMAEQVGRSGQDESFKIFEEMLLWIIHQSARSKARGQNLPELLRERQELFQRLSLEKLMKTGEQLEELFKKTRYSNLDNRQAVLQAFSVIAA